MLFPKPGKRRPVPVRVMSGGREVCDTNTVAGKQEYRKRIEEMRLRQRGQCCLEGWCPDCPGALSERESTFEHEGGRGMGGAKRDDRTELPNGTWINGAAHGLCNNWKASRYIDYNRSLQRRPFAEITALQEECDG